MDGGGAAAPAAQSGAAQRRVRRGDVDTDDEDFDDDLPYSSEYMESNQVYQCPSSYNEAFICHNSEKWEEAICPEIVAQYQDVGHTYLKFVVATEEDAEEAMEAIELYKSTGFKGSVYLMPVGGIESVYAMNNRKVAEMAMKNGLRYSDRLQVPLFKNEWGT
jgi:hypothetical protein